MEIIQGEIDIEETDRFFDELEEVEREYNSVIMGFDPRYIAYSEHLERAWSKAVRARNRDEMVADDIGMELLLYTAGTRQIDDAVEIGLDEDTDEAVFVLDGDTERSRGVLEKYGFSEADIEYMGPSLVKEFFDISRGELDAVGEEKLSYLVLERVALLDINK